MPDRSPADPHDPPGTAAAPVASVVVLAAGAGTRMRSSRPKVLHELAGQPLLWHALQAAAALAPEDLVDSTYIKRLRQRERTDGGRR